MCCLVVASLASWSALSFPRSPTCAGIHRRWIRWPGRSRTRRIRGTRAVAEMDGGWGLDRARSPDFESVNMVALVVSSLDFCYGLLDRHEFTDEGGSPVAESVLQGESGGVDCSAGLVFQCGGICIYWECLLRRRVE